MTFNVLIATLGRSSLQRMLDSLSPQLEESDCLTLVFDGHIEIPSFDLTAFKCQIKQFCEANALGSWGHPIRNKYADLLERRDFVMHADDDDIYLPNVFSELRTQCIDNETLYIARMNLTGDKRVVPEGDFIKAWHIGTPNGIIPYDLNSKGTWKLHHGGDGLFYEGLAPQAKNIQFLSTIIYQV
jgi:hypothetical protein